MDRPQPALPDSTGELAPLTVIRTETALSRYPIHRIAKRGSITIEIRREEPDGTAALLWEVSHNSKYGQPGPLAYKLDTLVINRRIEEAGKPAPKLLKLGSLKEIAEELDLGRDTNTVKRALLQNAFAAIAARITYRGTDRTQKSLDAAFTRYSVLFTGETLPDGRKADAVYLVLNDIYKEVLDTAVARPLDYDYLKALAPGPQRFYEIVSYQIYAALHHQNPRARLAYSEYCALSTQTRYLDFEHVKKQMYKVHLPHLRSGYLAKVEYEATTDADGKPDWHLFYVPGPNAAAEYRAFKGGGNQAVQKLSKKLQPEQRPLPFASKEPQAQDEATAALVEELIRNDLNRDKAVRYAREDPQECRRQLAFVSCMAEEDFTSGRGAYLNEAIPGRYGPPKAYTQEKRQQEAQRKRVAEVARKDARKGAQEARREAIVAEGMEWIGRLEKEAPEVYSAFLGHIEQVRQRMLRQFKGQKAQESYRRLYASDTKRVEMLADYFAAKSCPLPALAAWIEKHDPEFKKLLNS